MVRSDLMLSGNISHTTLVRIIPNGKEKTLVMSQFMYGFNDGKENQAHVRSVVELGYQER